jgi:hypothetical protein
MFKALQWEDWLGIALGAWLLVSPWALGFSDQTAPTMNARVMGTVLVLEELLELYVHEAAEEWMDVAAGVWLLLSPVMLGFTMVTSATISTIAVGALSVLFALRALSPLDEAARQWWRDHVPGH